MINETNIMVNPSPITNLNPAVSPIKLKVANEAVDSLITEGGEDFYNYVNRIGLAKDPSMIVLSSLHSYYYGTEEINKANTIVNLKELNQIKQIKSILQLYLQFLPQNCNFVGCFVNNKKVERFELRNGSNLIGNKSISDSIELGIVSRFPLLNRIYSIMDSKTNTYMSEMSVTLLLKDFGFKVMDMTEFNGLTFFHSQKVGKNYN
jgi:hypothetical protein